MCNPIGQAKTNLIVPTSNGKIINNGIEFDSRDRVCRTRLKRHIVRLRSRIENVHIFFGLDEAMLLASSDRYVNILISERRKRVGVRRHSKVDDGEQTRTVRERNLLRLGWFPGAWSTAFALSIRLSQRLDHHHIHVHPQTVAVNGHPRQY